MDLLRRHEWVLLGLIFSLGVFLRTHNLEQLLYFTYDQGRDAFVIREMITEKPVRLIGPTTGLPGVFTGPFYYYLLLPGYFLSGGDPVGAAIYMALLASLAMLILFFFAREMFNTKIALLTTFLFAILPGPVTFARFLFNPNPTAPVGILFFWMLYRAVVRNAWYWIPAFLLLGLLLELEMAIAIFYIPVVIVIAIWSMVRRKFQTIPFLLGIVLLLSTFLPLLAFNFRHEQIVSTSLAASIQDKSTHTSLQDVLEKRPPVYYNIFVTHLFRQGILGFVGVSAIFGGAVIVWQLVRQKKIPLSTGFFLSIWFFIPPVLLLFYTGNYGLISDYYFLPQFPVGIVFLSVFISALSRKTMFINREGIPWRYIVLPFLGFLVANALFYHEGVLDPKYSNYNIGLQRQTVEYVFSESNGQQPYTSIFVPNGQTEHYDYLFQYYARIGQRPPPINLFPEEISQQESYFLIYEPDPVKERGRFIDWYEKAASGSAIIDTRQYGIISVEKRRRDNEIL